MKRYNVDPPNERGLTESPTGTVLIRPEAAAAVLPVLRSLMRRMEYSELIGKTDQLGKRDQAAYDAAAALIAEMEKP